MSSTQQQAPPRAGMQRIPLALESYEHPSPPLSAKRLINMMVEQAPEDARTQTPVLSTPTLQLYGTYGSGPILAMNDDLPGRLYLVSGTHFYRLSFLSGAPTVEDLGDVGSPASDVPLVTIAVGQTAAVVCVSPRAYTCGHAVGDPLNEITDPAFPGARSVTFCDGYYCFSSSANDAQWFISKVSDPTSFDALDFVFSDAVPNVIRRLITHRGQIWTLGETGFEVWYDAGSSGLETGGTISFFPFRRAAGGVVPVGTNSPMSVSRADQSVWWLGMDGVVYRSNGYAPVRVSTHAIEAIIGNSIINLNAITHAYRGHWFYCLTTADNRTLCYDISTQKWHERSTSTDGNGPWQAATAAVYNNSIHLYGDRTNGNLYTLTMGPDDAGVAGIIRYMAMAPLWAGTNRAFCARLEVEMEVGGPQTPGQVLLDWSDDGARTYRSPQRAMSSGVVGDTKHRVYTTRLGSFRQRTFRLQCHGLVRWYAADADIVGGSS
jgi:hypothetical protein